jgi:uncharacterized zinc-type alcohol dehydrogenase-like protein
MFRCDGYAAGSATTALAHFEFERRSPGPRDVVIEIDFCGVCHSDLNRARSVWGGTLYPCVPGHEIVGRVKQVGAEVRRFAERQRVGVGVLVDSCRHCANCSQGFPQYCDEGATETYNSMDRRTGGHTFGGYSSHIVVDEDFVLSLPEALESAATAPLLCAGITTYSPLKRWQVRPGSRVAVVGLGGLGHVGVKMAAAFGAEVVLFTTSPGKLGEAARLGASRAVLSNDPKAIAAETNSFDFVLDTVSADHDVDALLALLRRDGVLVQVGVPAERYSIHAGSLIAKRRSLAGSGIGGLAETQEMLEFCAAKGVAADIEMIGIDEIDAAFDRMLRHDIKYRFVIDMRKLARAAG